MASMKNELVSDDLSLLALAFDEAMFIDDGSNNDERLAEKLQIQELLVSSNTNSAIAILGQDIIKNSVSKIIYCDICKQSIPLIDVMPKVACSHPLCRECLYWYINKMLEISESNILCSNTSCGVVLEPAIYRDFLPSELFDKWIISNCNDKSKKDLIQISKQIANAENEGNDSNFEINHGLLVKLSKAVDTMITYMDMKGKELIEFNSSVKEIGESSSTAANQLVVLQFYCAICMERKDTAEIFTVETCLHQFCIDCMMKYITTNVEENVLVIKCPEPDCKEGVLNPEMCRPILAEDIFDRWGLALCESALGIKKFYCPFRECSTLMLVEGKDEDGVITNAECPHCHRMFCAQCKVPWHDGIDCNDFQQLGEHERGSEDIMLRNLAAMSKWQRCPNCKMFVEKIDGCMFMKCRCSYCFCYVCATQMNKDDHYCTKCQR